MAQNESTSDGMNRGEWFYFINKATTTFPDGPTKKASHRKQTPRLQVVRRVTMKILNPYVNRSDARFINFLT